MHITYATCGFSHATRNIQTLQPQRWRRHIKTTHTVNIRKTTHLTCLCWNISCLLLAVSEFRSFLWPVSPLSPTNMMYTLAVVPASSKSPVKTSNLYVNTYHTSKVIYAFKTAKLNLIAVTHIRKTQWHLSLLHNITWFVKLVDVHL